MTRLKNMSKLVPASSHTQHPRISWSLYLFQLKQRLANSLFFLYLLPLLYKKNGSYSRRLTKSIKNERAQREKKEHYLIFFLTIILFCLFFTYLFILNSAWYFFPFLCLPYSIDIMVQILTSHEILINRKSAEGKSEQPFSVSSWFIHAVRKLNNMKSLQKGWSAHRDRKRISVPCLTQHTSERKLERTDLEGEELIKLAWSNTAQRRENLSARRWKGKNQCSFPDPLHGIQHTREKTDRIEMSKGSLKFAWSKTPFRGGITDRTE